MSHVQFDDINVQPPKRCMLTSGQAHGGAVPVASSGNREQTELAPELHASMVREVHALGNSLGPLVSLTEAAAADPQTPNNVRNLLAECRNLLATAAGATSRLSGLIRRLGPNEGAPERVGKKLAATSANPTDLLPKLHLLCVEDDRSVREMLVKLLKLLGQKADAVGSVSEALTAFGKAHYDAVITDLRLGTESGQELTVQLRNQRPIPVIWITGFDDGGDLSQLDPSAAPTFLLEKPLSVDGLKNALRIASSSQ